MTHYNISASILSADFAHLGREVKTVLAAGVDSIHIDVMDNHYVPNLTFGPLVCTALRKADITAPLAVHIMAKPVDALISAFIDAGASSITIHPEATEHLDRSLQLIQRGNCQVGIALNPSTGLHCLEYVLEQIDEVLIMTVNPGFGGQTFIPGMLSKITQVRAWLNERKASVQIAVDGGVNQTNIRQIAAAGANTLVMGSAIFSQQDNTHDYKKVIQALRTELDAVNKITQLSN